MKSVQFSLKPSCIATPDVVHNLQRAYCDEKTEYLAQFGSQYRKIFTCSHDWISKGHREDPSIVSRGCVQPKPPSTITLTIRWRVSLEYGGRPPPA
jgi:hypothetical protein